MLLYNESKQMIEVDISDGNFIGRGVTAEVYNYFGDEAIKIYNADAMFEWKLKKAIFEKMKNIDSDNFVKIYELLYRKSEFEDDIDVYRMKYYEDANIDILEMDIDYLLDNVTDIHKLFDELAKNKIAVNDVKSANCILGNNNMVIIDPDLFKIKRMRLIVLKQVIICV